MLVKRYRNILLNKQVNNYKMLKIILIIYILSFIIGGIFMLTQHIKYHKYHIKSMIRANGAYYYRKSKNKKK